MNPMTTRPYGPRWTKFRATIKNRDGSTFERIFRAPDASAAEAIATDTHCKAGDEVQDVEEI